MSINSALDHYTLNIKDFNNTQLWSIFQGVHKTYLCILYMSEDKALGKIYEKTKLSHREKNKFNFKDEIYLKMKSVSNMKYLNYVITFPQYFFFLNQGGLTKETISNKKSTSKQKFVSCNSDDSLLSPGPIWSLACNVLLKGQNSLYQV